MQYKNMVRNLQVHDSKPNDGISTGQVSYQPES
jgi:hypothetical protein